MDADTKAAVAALRDHLDNLTRITEAEHEVIKHRILQLEKKVSTICEVLPSTAKLIKALAALDP